MWRPRAGRIALALLAASALGTGATIAAITQIDPATVPHGWLVTGSQVRTPINLKVDQSRTHIFGDGEVIFVQHVVIGPGKDTGWHSHAGPVFVTLVSGALTLYEGDDKTCTGTTYRAGQGFVDEGFGNVHIARNEGTVPADLYATYVLPTGSTAADVKIPMPGFSNPACGF